MKDFLNEYITTLTSNQRTNILTLLATTEVEKQSLDAIVAKLAAFNGNNPLAITPEVYGSLVEASKFDGVYQESFRKFKQLFEVSNLISILIDSHNTILSSEVKALEDELHAIQKAIDNYAFTLSDNGFYDFSYIETFSDEMMKETDESTYFSDRSGTDFDKNEMAMVNSASGILTLSPELLVSHGLSGQVTDSNCLGYATSNTGISNALNKNSSDGWRVAISSPRPITSSLSGVSQNGAQIKTEFYIATPAPCDSLLLTPFSDIPVEILSITLFPQHKSETTDGVIVLSEKKTIDRPTTISFPFQPVAKFSVVFNQPVFNRNAQPANKYEQNHRFLFQNIMNRKKATEKNWDLTTSYQNNIKALKRIFLKTQKLSNPNYKLFRSEAPQLNLSLDRGVYSLDRRIKGPDHFAQRTKMWSFESKVDTLLRRMIHESVFANNEHLLNQTSVYSSSANIQISKSALELQLASGSNINNLSLDIEPQVNKYLLADPHLSETVYLQYNYDIGMRNIQIGTGNKIYRGVFVSKQIPAPTDSGEIKLKASDINYEIVGTSRDSAKVTSTEYSVSNKSNPKSELDWIPVLPIDQELVTGERIFFTNAGIGFLRFNASLDNTLVLYQNGFKVSSDLISFIKSTDSQAITGIRLTSNSFLNTDIFTVDYTPLPGQHFVNFAEKGFSQSLLTSAYDGNGAGETFSSGTSSQTINLKFEPFVDYEAVAANGSYSTTLGFTGSYQPVTIILEDGTQALNQTNYIGILQNNLTNFDDSQIAFIHSGKNIIFNRSISQKFTVYYQYIPSNLRFRCILRVNSLDYVSPSVDFVQIKAKTLKSNPKKVF